MPKEAEGQEVEEEDELKFHNFKELHYFHLDYGAYRTISELY